MIGFNYLGNLGHLGNQMFQYAALKGISSKMGYDWCIPPKEYAGKFYQLKLLSDIYSCFELYSCHNYKMIEGNTITESSYSFDENLFLNCPDNVSIHGYFQSEKYFKHIEDDIRKDFTFKKEIINECLQIISDIFDDIENVVSLHIRRGDYLKNSNHPIQSLEWYEQSINKFDSDHKIVIFSDDPQWCFEQKLFESDRFIISQGNSAFHDLCLMSMLKKHIICNSSFSWWGAWLANSNKVIAPKNWFGGSCINHNTSDLYCPEWVII